MIDLLQPLLPHIRSHEEEQEIARQQAEADRFFRRPAPDGFGAALRQRCFPHRFLEESKAENAP